jgi:hypothetical protein
MKVLSTLSDLNLVDGEGEKQERMVILSRVEGWCRGPAHHGSTGSP